MISAYYEETRLRQGNNIVNCTITEPVNKMIMLSCQLRPEIEILKQQPLSAERHGI